MTKNCEDKCKPGGSLPYEPKPGQKFNYQPDIIEVSCETVMNQTEQAINVLDSRIDEVDLKANESGDLAKQALTAAGEAWVEAEKGQTMAQTALDQIVEVKQDLASTDALANQALSKANDALDKAGDVDAKADGIKSDLDTHIADKSNPHEVTATQTGAYTRGETDDLIGGLNESVISHNQAPEAHSILFGTKIRQRLQGDTTIYIRMDGNDSNDGLSNTASGALMTFNGVNEWLRSKDGCGYSLTISCAPGTYDAYGLLSRGWDGEITITSTDINNRANINRAVTMHGQILTFTNVICSAFGGYGTTFGNNIKITGYPDIYACINVFYGKCFLAGTTEIDCEGKIVRNIISLGRTAVALIEGTLEIKNVTAKYAVATVASGSIFDCQGLKISGENVNGPRYRVIQSGVLIASGNTIPGTIEGFTESGGNYIP